MGIRRRRIDASSPTARVPIDKQDDHLASTDVPGSDPPQMSRYQGEWNPGRIDARSTVTTEIQTSPSGIVTIGDMAIAAHTQIRDAIIGTEAVNALIMQAKVVADDTVRISLHNPSIAAGIQIPSGALHVVAMSAVYTRGHSNDAWGVLHTATETLSAGERIYAVVRCRVPGDFLQALKQCFLQIESSADSSLAFFNLRRIRMRTLLNTVAAIFSLVGCVASHAQYREQYIEESKAWGSAVADFNLDGHDDFLIPGHDSDDRIWYWSPSGYVPSLQLLEWVDRHDCDAADVNLDGLPDIYCTVGAEKGLGIGYNELWMQQKDGTFVKTADFGAEDPYGRGRLPLFFDMNHDGYPDIYLTNLATIRPDGQPNINRVFVNRAGSGFSEKTTIATGARGAQCVAKGDIDQDGWDDLLVCYEKGIGHLYLNNKHGDFDELMSPALGGEWRMAKLSDMNDDGRDDLVLITDTSIFSDLAQYREG